jgi:hypothetical protein
MKDPIHSALEQRRQGLGIQQVGAPNLGAELAQEAGILASSHGGAEPDAALGEACRQVPPQESRGAGDERDAVELHLGPPPELCIRRVLLSASENITFSEYSIRQ